MFVLLLKTMHFLFPRMLQEKKPKELVESRLERLMGYGKFKEAQER